MSAPWVELVEFADVAQGIELVAIAPTEHLPQRFGKVPAASVHLALAAYRLTGRFSIGRETAGRSKDFINGWLQVQIPFGKYLAGSRTIDARLIQER